MIEIKRYTPQEKQDWNDFVAKSRQGTFLFDRNYMDYHQDRFHDHSLMIFYNGKLCALLPANEVVDKTLVSHQGLTYGGLLTCKKMTAAITCQVFDAINIYLKERGFQKVIYKAIPWIYHNIPSEEDLYAIMQTCKARLLAREISTTIPLMHKLRFPNKEEEEFIRPTAATCLSMKQT